MDPPTPADVLLRERYEAPRRRSRWRPAAPAAKVATEERATSGAEGEFDLRLVAQVFTWYCTIYKLDASPYPFLLGEKMDVEAENPEEPDGEASQWTGLTIPDFLKRFVFRCNVPLALRRWTLLTQQSLVARHGYSQAI